MKTIFYKILYKGKSVIYVGVTTRELIQRFNEHLKQKKLTSKDYSIVKFYEIKHPEINSLEIFYREREKVAKLECNYIKEELKKGSNLLNLSEGGEWGSQILNKLREREFFKKFGSYEGYQEYRKKKDKIKRWASHWIEHKSKNRTKVWLQCWIYSRHKDKIKTWIQSWMYSKSIKKVKKWLKSWTVNTKGTKVWVHHWIYGKSKKKIKTWLRNWLLHRTERNSKVWLSNWIYGKSKKKIKTWLRNWINHRSESKVKTWLRNWINHRENRKI